MLHASRAGRLRPFRHVESSLLPSNCPFSIPISVLAGHGLLRGLTLVFKGRSCSFNIDSVSSPNLSATAKKSFIRKLSVLHDLVLGGIPTSRSNPVTLFERGIAGTAQLLGKHPRPWISGTDSKKAGTRLLKNQSRRMLSGLMQEHEMARLVLWKILRTPTLEEAQTAISAPCSGLILRIVKDRQRDRASYLQPDTQ